MIRRIHLRKTAALIAASLATGAVVGGAKPAVRERLAEAGRQLGLAFQAADDVLDVTATSAQIGKTAGKDRVAEKATWVRAEGLEAARLRARRYGQRGLVLLEGALPAGPRTLRLLDLARIMWQRDH